MSDRKLIEAYLSGIRERLDIAAREMFSLQQALAEASLALETLTGIVGLGDD